MEIYNCVIVDDSEIDQLRLKGLLRKFPQFNLVGSFLSPQKALNALEDINVEVLFLDIEMPGINGLEFRKRTEHIPACVFVSYSPEYALKSFETQIVDYLVKPLEYNRFTKTVRKIESLIGLTRMATQAVPADEPLFLKSGNKQVRFNANSILYIEALSDYTQAVTNDGKQVISFPLGRVLNDDAFKSFIRIHRSYAVPRQSVFKFSRKEIILKNGTTLPIGKTYRDAVTQNLSEYNV